ncbi:MAG: DUF4954 family protein [Alistipes sp.]
MEEFRKLTAAEIGTLETLGNRADDWSRIAVAPDFYPTQLHNVRLEGDVRIGSHAVIENSRVANYSIGAHTLVRDVTALECRHRSAFGNGTEVEAVNECGGRTIRIFDRISAQYAYIVAMYRHRTATIERLNGFAAEYAERNYSTTGRIGEGCRIVGARFVREVAIGNNVTIEGASLLENGTLLDGAHAGIDVKARDFIAVEDSTIDTGATCHRCFIGEKAIVANGFTAENSLFFSGSHCENGEAVAVFAGPFTVSHHKSSLLISGLFSFFNAGSGTNQSNHLFKGGAVHQAVHLRGCKFASNAYVMAPAIEGAYTMIMGRHHHHHDTSAMPFSYLIENDDRSLLMPALNLRSYGTARDIVKWQQRDKRTLRRDVIDFAEYNPYIAERVLRAIAILRNLHDGHPDDDVYRYNNTLIRRSSLIYGLKLYEKYIDCALGDMLSRGTTTNDSSDCDMWTDVAGQYIAKGHLDSLLDDIERGETAPCDIDALLRLYDADYDNHAHAWAVAALAERIGHTPTESDIADQIARGIDARNSMREIVEADLAKENSAEMSVGYGVDCNTAEERLADFKIVRGLK